MLGLIDDELLTDRIVIVTPIDGQDVSGGPTEGDGTLSPELPAIVSKLQFRQERTPQQSTVQGIDFWTILLNVDPRPYGLIRPDQPIRWTEHNGVAKVPYGLFISKGPVQDPGGLLDCWMLSVQRVN